MKDYLQAIMIEQKTNRNWPVCFTRKNMVKKILDFNLDDKKYEIFESPIKTDYALFAIVYFNKNDNDYDNLNLEKKEEITKKAIRLLELKFCQLN